MASVYDKIWLPIKAKPKPPEPTWTGRADTLNTQPYYDAAQKKTAGLFHIAGLVNEEGLQRTITAGLGFLERLIDEAEEEIHLRPVWSILEAFKIFRHEMMSLMVFLESYHPEESYRVLAKQATKAVLKLYERLKYSYTVYRALLIDGSPQTMFEKFIAAQLQKVFERQGFAPSDCPVDTVIQFQVDIKELVEAFKANNVEARRPFLIDESAASAATSQRSLVKEDEEEEAAEEEENVRQVEATLLSDSGRARTEFYAHFYTFDKAQADLLEQLLDKRHELAVMNGFESFSHKAVLDTPFAGPKEAGFLIKYLSDHIREAASNEFAIMSALKEGLDGVPFVISDIEYMSNFARDQICQEIQHRIRDYLTLGAVVDGINRLFNKIFFITFDVSSMLSDEIHVGDMYKLQVIHVTWGLVGYIYLDVMKRPGKPQLPPTHHVVREGKFEEDNEYISKKKWRPTRIVLVMSIENSGFPAVLSVDEAENLFVEMGKLIPELLYHFPQQFITRVLCNVDIKAILAALMRKLFYHPKVMKMIFKSYPNGDPIEKANMYRVINSRRIFMSSYYQELVLKAAVDQAVYAEYTLRRRLVDVFKKYDKLHYSVPMNQNCYIHLRSDYLVDEKFCGKYYMRLVNLAVAIRLWKRFFQSNPLDPEASDSFMMCIYDALPVTDVKQCYAQLLDMDIDLVKIAKVIIDDARENYEATIDCLENLIEPSIKKSKTSVILHSEHNIWDFEV